jgi:hypothetical protein
LKLSAENVGRSHLRAYVRAKEILLRRSGRHRERQRPSVAPFKIKPAELAKPLRPAFKSWLDYTAVEN